MYFPHGPRSLLAELGSHSTLTLTERLGLPEAEGDTENLGSELFFPVKSHLEHSFGVLKYWFCLFSQNLTRKGFQCYKKPEK